jgi:hypothetical protein
MNKLVTDRDDWKLRIKTRDIDFPDGYKHFEFIREQYNDLGELTNTSVYDFFLSKDEVNRLSEIVCSEAQ